MFATHPQNNPTGVLAIHDSLMKHSFLSRSCGELRLTAPVIRVGLKLAYREPLTPEEAGIAQGLTIKRGPKDWIQAPIVGGQFNEDSGFLAALDGLRLAGLLESLPQKASGLTKPDDILFSTYIRLKTLSVLWDLADGINKGHPLGSPKPWVIQELQILGFISVGEPVRDGTKGRPPLHLIINSWGRQFVEATRKYMGVDISDEQRRMARRRSGVPAARFSMTDKLAAGYLSRSEEIPPNVVKRMSDHGKTELSKAYGVEL